MTTLITRLYADNGTASDVSSALLANGMVEDNVGIIGGSEADARKAMADVGVSDDAAEAYASRIAGGNALVTVRAPFGMAGRAVTTMKKFEAIDVGVDNEDAYVGYKTDPAMNSSIIKGNKKFLTGKGVTESGWRFTPFGIPILSGNQKGRAKVDTSTISSKFGMATIKQPKAANSVLRDNPTPFSSMFGMSTVKRSRGKKSVITDNPTPLSSALGWPTIADPD